jgi:hypothetical protein
MNLGVIELTIILDSGLLAINKYVNVNTNNGVARLYTQDGRILSTTGETTTDASGKLRIYVPKTSEYSIFVRSTPTQKTPLYSKFNISPIPIIDADTASTSAVTTPPSVPVQSAVIDSTTSATSSTTTTNNNAPTVVTFGKMLKGTASVTPIDINLAANELYGISLWIKLVPDQACCLRMEFSSNNGVSWYQAESSAHRSATYQYTAAASEPWITHIRIFQLSGASSNISNWAIWP